MPGDTSNGFAAPLREKRLMFQRALRGETGVVALIGFTERGLSGFAPFSGPAGSPAERGSTLSSAGVPTTTDRPCHLLTRAAGDGIDPRRMLTVTGGGRPRGRLRQG